MMKMLWPEAYRNLTPHFSGSSDSVVTDSMLPVALQNGTTTNENWSHAQSLTTPFTFPKRRESRMALLPPLQSPGVSPSLQSVGMKERGLNRQDSPLEAPRRISPGRGLGLQGTDSVAALHMSCEENRCLGLPWGWDVRWRKRGPRYLSKTWGDQSLSC